jgi:LCP family protein required for cell wall assembly
MATGEPIGAPPIPASPPAYAPPGRVPRIPERVRTLFRQKWARRVGYGLMFLAIVAMILAAFGIHRLSDIGGKISNQAPFSTQTGFMTGANRVNLLIMGYGGAGHDGAYLTDSMMVVSVIPDSGSTTEISVPRDLWVQVPPNSGNYAKINSTFEDGFYNGYGGTSAGQIAGGNEAAAKVSDILGMSVPYWVTINFNGFREVVDSLGGIDINVPVAFTANYPINDDPSINAGWKVIHFNKGPQHMNGEQAIEYARARYVTDPVSEASDFARSARQQLLIRAILSKARQVSSWTGLNGTADALTKAIYTNFSLLDLMLFTLRMDTTHAAHIGLSTSNVLVGSQSSDGQSILQPANGDWGSIQQYVAQNLKP